MTEIEKLVERLRGTHVKIAKNELGDIGPVAVTSLEAADTITELAARAEKAEAERDAAVAALAKAETLTIDAIRAAVGGHKVALTQTVERAAWVARHADLPDRPWTPGFYATARQDIAAAILSDAALASNSWGG